MSLSYNAKLLSLILCSQILASPWQIHAKQVTKTGIKTELTEAKLSKCSVWYLLAKKAVLRDKTVSLTEPQITFGPITLPLLVRDIPLDGTSKSGLLIPRIGRGYSIGNFVKIPLYLSGKSDAELALVISSLLGSIVTVKQQISNIDAWLAVNRRFHAWKIESRKVFDKLEFNWSDTSNTSLRLPNLNVNQGRLERFIKLAIKDNFIFEIFSPKTLDLNLAPKYDHLPQITWQYHHKINYLWWHQQLQFTNFSLQDNAISRIVANQDLAYIDPAILAKLGLHIVSEPAGHVAIPWLFIDINKKIQQFESRLTLRYAPYIAQNAFPILDTEVLQRNIATWLSERYYVGQDRWSDVKSIALSVIEDNTDWRNMLSIRFNSPSKIHTTYPSELAIGLENRLGLKLFLLHNKDGWDYLSANYTKTLNNNQLVFGYRHDNQIDLPAHWFIGFTKQINAGFRVSGEFTYLNTNQQHAKIGQISLTGDKKCWRWQLFAKWQNITENQPFHTFGFKVTIS